MTNAFWQIILPLSIFLIMAVLGSIIIMILPFVFGSRMIPTYSVSKTRIIDMSVEKLFNLLSDYSAYPNWRKYLKKTEVKTNKEGKTVWDEYYKLSKRPIEFTEIKKENNKILIFTSITNEYLAAWTMTFTNEGDEKTTLVIKETAFFPHPHIRFFSKFLVQKERSIKDMFNCIIKESERMKNDKL